MNSVDRMTHKLGYLRQKAGCVLAGRMMVLAMRKLMQLALAVRESG